MSAPKNIPEVQQAGYVQLPDGTWAKPRRRWPWERSFLAPAAVSEPVNPKRIRQSGKALLNKTEGKWEAILDMRGITGILEQAITLRLDPPFKSYRPDMAYIRDGQLTLVEVKGPHRFREKGIARAALAAKTYPMFRFELADWTGKEWKESVFTP